MEDAKLNNLKILVQNFDNLVTGKCMLNTIMFLIAKFLLPRRRLSTYYKMHAQLVIIIIAHK